MGLSFWIVAAKDAVLIWAYTLFVLFESFVHLIVPPKMKSLKDEIILITGSAKGIGLSICKELAKSGAKLVCWDIDKWQNDAVIKELRSLGATVFGYDVDVSDRQKIRSVAEQVKKDVGDVTMIINNAGIMPCHEFLSHNPKEIIRAFEVNILSQMWIVREFLPRMIERKTGHIVAMSSAAGLVGQRNIAVYSSTKFAVNGFMEALQDEISHLPGNVDIKFTTIHATPCETSFAKNVVHTRFPWILPAFMQPEHVAKKAIEGIRRNKACVCIPQSLVIFGFLLKSLPTKVFNQAKKLLGVHVEPRIR